MSKIRTVVFGGSFNPVHKGHVALAQAVCEKGLADEVWLMVSPHNPLKEALGLAPENHRLRMVQLAIEGLPGLKACDFEFGLPRPSYTVNTLAELEKNFPEREFMLLIGADNWENFGAWYKSEEILSRYRIIVYPRDCEKETLSLPEGVMWLRAPLLDVSSTQVREAVAAGYPVDDYVTGEVAVYIKENGLYKNK